MSKYFQSKAEQYLHCVSLFMQIPDGEFFFIDPLAEGRAETGRYRH